MKQKAVRFFWTEPLNSVLEYMHWQIISATIKWDKLQLYLTADSDSDHHAFQWSTQYHMMIRLKACEERGLVEVSAWNPLLSIISLTTQATSKICTLISYSACIHKRINHNVLTQIENTVCKDTGGHWPFSFGMMKNFMVKPTIVLITLIWDQKHTTCYTGDKNILHKKQKQHLIQQTKIHYTGNKNTLYTRQHTTHKIERKHRLLCMWNSA